MLLLPVILASCGEEVIPEENKKDYNLEVKSIGEFWNNHVIEKTGKIASSQDISLTSKVNGEIGTIFVKAGDRVTKGQPLMGVSDSTANYGGSLEWASIAIESAKINLESQRISLDKAVADTALNLKRTKTNFDISKSQIEEDIKKAKIDFENSDLNNVDSNSTLQLEKLDQSISKAELDYDNQVLQNQQQVNTFISNAKNEYESIVLLYTDIIEFSDTILGVSELNEDKNDSYETFLGASNKQSLTDSKDMFAKLLAYKEKLEAISTNDINEANVLSFLEEFQDGHTLLNDFLTTFEKMLLSSVDSVGFPKDTFITQVNGYQTQVQGWRTGFLGTKNAISTFLNTYKFNEESTQKQIELLYKDREITKSSLDDGDALGQIAYNKTILSLEDQLSALETALENSQITYDNAIKTREVTIKNLENQIRNARNGYSTAYKEYKKLSVTSPIDGVIGDISAQEGQEVNVGSPLLSIANIEEGEIEVFLSKEELQYIDEDDIVSVVIDGEEMGGIIYSISKIANSNLNYGAKVRLDEDVAIVGGIVKVHIPVVLDQLILPVRLVETLGNNKAQIKTYSGSGIVNTVVDLGNIWGNSIEITTSIDPETEIITSEIQNFDEAKFNLKVNQPESDTK